MATPSNCGEFVKPWLPSNNGNVIMAGVMTYGMVKTSRMIGFF